MKPITLSLTLLGVLAFIFGATPFSFTTKVNNTVPPPSCGTCVQSDSTSPDSCILVEFALALEYDDWQEGCKWNFNDSIESWCGVVLNENRRVIEIILPSNNLSGEIPTCIGELIFLRSLNLRTNNITGSIPPTITALVNLRYLQLHRNSITGNIPEDFGLLINLDSIDLSYNEIEGKIPESFYSITNLKKINLRFNNIRDTISKAINQFENIETIFLRGNEFYGLIPKQIGGLSKLKNLELSYNNLTGVIPGSVGNLQNLTTLYLNGNQFSTLSEDVGNLQNLTILDLSDNQFNTLPESIGNLQSLIGLGLSRNELTAIPSIIGNLNALRYLTVFRNQIGNIPESLLRLKKLESLDLSYNFLTNVSFLIELHPTNNGNLYDLDISYNQLTFKELIPLMSFIGIEDEHPNPNFSGEFRYWPQSFISHNNFIIDDLCQNISLGFDENVIGSEYTWTNTITEDTITVRDDNTLNICFNSCDSLHELVYHCSITNTFVPNLSLRTSITIQYKPSQVFDKQTLLSFAEGLGDEAWRNKWTFNEPLANWHGITVNEDGRVVELDLSNNNLTGQIPVEIGDLHFLRKLSLSGNELEGAIPASFRQLGCLEELSLDGNKLTEGLDYLPLANLNALDLGSNNFTDTSIAIAQLLSSWLDGSYPNLIDLDLSDNKFSGAYALTAASSLRSLRLNGNQIKQVIIDSQDLPPSLEKLEIQDNQIEFLPDLSTAVFPTGNLRYLRLENNRLTFEDILPNMVFASSPEQIEFSYAPQDTIQLSTNFFSVNTCDSISLGFDEFMVTNEYHWECLVPGYDTVIAGSNQLSGCYEGSPGNIYPYFCSITNPAVPGLTLYTPEITLECIDCPSVEDRAQLLLKDTITVRQLDAFCVPLKFRDQIDDLDIYLDWNNELLELLPDELDLRSVNGKKVNALRTVDTKERLNVKWDNPSDEPYTSTTDSILLKVCFQPSENIVAPRTIIRLQEGDNPTTDRPLLARNALVRFDLGINRDSINLVKLYQALDWENEEKKWVLEDEMDTWEGVRVNGAGRVIELNLSSFSLAGSLPEGIELPYLRYLDLSYNELEGLIPLFFGMPRLESINLLNNLFEGDIPNLEHLRYLRKLDVGFNELNMEIPDLYSRMPSLEYVNVRENRLTFEHLIPKEAINKNIETRGYGSFSGYYFHPQKEVRIEQNPIFIKKGEPLDITLNIDRYLAGNTYVWYKNTEPIPISEGNPLMLQGSTFENGDKYYSEISNPALPDLILKTDTVTVRVHEEELFIPKAFSPNGDGINDTVEIPNLPDGSKMTIFNRYGDLIFQSESYKNEWDGTVNNQLLPPGAYIYRLEYQGNLLSGTITLIR